jgi:hypothetical protein
LVGEPGSRLKERRVAELACLGGSGGGVEG